MSKKIKKAGKVASTVKTVPLDTVDLQAAKFKELADWAHGDDLKLPAGCIHYKPLTRSCLAPITVGDLLLVEQQLCGYEEGEIAEIENVMAKERREISVRDLNRVTETTETAYTKEIEESSSMKVDERFSLMSQSQEAQSQQSSISGNFSASYSAPAFSATIGANASYTTSKDSSYSTSQEYAKTITNEASQRIKESISEVKSVTVVTENVKTTLRGFDNTAGVTHIQGIYRWVDKKYDAQLFDYGKRLFLQFHIPEPAFYLRDIKKLIERETLAELNPPVHPRDRRTSIKSYADIDENNYGELAAEYDVTDITPPPPKTLIKGKSIAHPEEDPGDTDMHNADANEPTLAKKIDSILVDQGYHLTRYQANIPTVRLSRPDKNGDNADFLYGYYTTIGFSNTSNDVNLLLVNIMGTTCYYLTHNDSANNDKNIMVKTDRFDEWHPTSDKLEGEIPITVGAEFEGKFYFNFLYEMERNPETLTQWQIETFKKILEGYTNKLRDYEQLRKEAELARDNQIAEVELTPREDTYRQIEANELRKHCVDVMTRHSAYAEDPRKLNELPAGNHEINLDSILGFSNWQANNVNGAAAVFFEQSFEWESLTVNYYPYFWTDQKRWPDLFREAETGDAQFDQFLKAGYARVVVPIRPNYEKSVLYYLKTNMIWAGGEVPAFSDDTTLSLLEELHESVQLAKGNGRPVGAPWEIKVPTSFVYLQPNGDLPSFPCDLTSDAEPTELPSEEDIDAVGAELRRLISAGPDADRDGRVTAMTGNGDGGRDNG